MKSFPTALSLARHSRPRKSGRTVVYCVLAFAALALSPEVVVTPPPHVLNVAAQASVESSRAQQNPSHTPALEPNQTVEQELSPGELHSYQIKLKSGQYARFILECRGKGVKLSVDDPGGQPRTESECYQDGLMPVSVIADVSGDYRLNVGAQDEESISRRYQIKFEKLRRATKQDQSRILAERAVAEAERLRTGRGVESGHAAIKKYEEAQGHWQIAGERRAEADALRAIGQAYQSLDEYQKAFNYYNQALTLSHSVNDSRRESDILNDIGFLHFNIGDNQKALANAARALRLSRATGNRRGEAQALHTCGEAYYGFADLPKALGYFRQAIQLWRELNDYRGRVSVLVSFGYTYIETSDIRAALASFNEALSISRSANDLHWEAVTLRALGNLHTKLGENQQALEMFSKALEIAETLGERNLKATVLGGLGYAYDRVGEKRRALEYYSQGLAIVKELKLQWFEAETEMTIGELYYSLGENQVALQHSETALSLFRTLKIQRYEAETLKDIGLIYDSWGDKAKALDYYKQSLALTRAGQDQRYEAYTLNYIGRVYEGLGERQKALGHYRQALPLNRVAADPAGESLTLYNIARVERDEGRLDEARAGIEAALDISESLRTKVLSQDLRASFFASVRQHYELYIDVLTRLHRQRPAEGFEAAAFEVSERARARSLLESLKEARADIQQGVNPALLGRERSLQQALYAKAERRMRLFAGPHDAREAAALAREIEQLTTQYDEVRAQIRATSPHYAALTQPQPLGLAEIQRRVLDDETVLLEYALGDERSYVWAVTRTTVAGYELPGRARIEGAARRLYELLTAPQHVPGETAAEQQARAARAHADYWREADALGDMILGPVAEHLSGGRRLLVVADGALQYVPFVALTTPHGAGGTGVRPADALPDVRPDGGARAPLFTRHEVVSLPSASILAALQGEAAARVPADKSVAVFADPVFERDDPRIRPAAGAVPAEGDGGAERAGQHRALRDVDAFFGGGRIPRLLASRDEAEAIARALPAGEVTESTDFGASRAAATDPALSRHRVIHFATHGILNSEHPELSGIVLSLFDERGEPQEGFLYLNDIYNLDLPADLVVLSACNTALGREVKGEGLIGLTRGFMYAGAGAVVASLWKVDDEATAELMGHFYEGMFQRGLAPSAALRQAQLAMWRQKRWRAPYYWAAFVIQGQYGALKGVGERPSASSRWGLAAWGGGAAAISFAALYAIRLRRRRRRRKGLADPEAAKA